MEISSALLVAIMFGMILSIGIAAILTFLAQVVEPRSQQCGRDPHELGCSAAFSPFPPLLVYGRYRIRPRVGVIH